MAARSRFDTHEVFNQSPPYENVDLFSSDAAVAGRGQSERRGFDELSVARRLRQALGHRGDVRARPAGQRKPAEAADLRRQGLSQRHRRISSRLSPASCARALRPGCMPRPGPRTVSARRRRRKWPRAARFYMAAQVETGHLCPITMTRAALAALAAEPALAAKVVPKVVTPQLRSAVPSLARQIGHDARHGHDGEARRNRRARQHHDSDARRRGLFDCRP